MQTTYNADDLQEISNLTSASLLINIWRMSSAAVLKAARRVKQCNVEKGIKGNGLNCFCYCKLATSWQTMQTLF